jgi:hypothetical protein
VKERTGLQRSQVPNSYLDELEDGQTFSSLEEAREYVARIEADIAAESGDRTGEGSTPSRPDSDPSDTTDPTTTEPDTDPTDTDDSEPGDTTTTDGGISRG